MNELKSALNELKQSLCKEIDVGGLYARSAVAHKWKAPWRSLTLRETVAWRLQDLLEQSNALHASSNILGARILLRSAYETLAVLIYANQAMRNVVAGSKDFHEFSATTEKLLLGSRDKSTPYESINILTILKSAEKRYAGLNARYDALSESAHPNHEGMLRGYADHDRASFSTSFANKWKSRFGDDHTEAIFGCLEVFVHEYNDEWAEAFEELETWIDLNDAILETTKRKNADS